MPTMLRGLLGTLLLAVILTARSAASHHLACTNEDKSEKAVCVQICGLFRCKTLNEQQACQEAAKHHSRCGELCYQCPATSSAYRKTECPSGSTLVFCARKHCPTKWSNTDSQHASVAPKSPCLSEGQGLPAL